MNQSDLMPSRMERARLKVADFAAERKGQPLGLVTYAGTAHLVLPPTRDTSVVATMSAEIGPEIMPKPGDDLAGALQVAANTLGDSGGSIVVFADTVAESADSALAGFHAENPLPVYFLAIARADTPEYDAIRRVASPLKADVTLMTPDTEDVRSLARVCWKGAGCNWRGRRRDTLGRGGLVARAVARPALIDLIPPCPESRTNGGNRMKTLVALAIVGAITWWSLWFTPDQQGQRLMNRGEFQAAAETFRDPMRQGVAWFRAGEFEKAEQAFARLGTADAEFNRGNCLIMRGKYDQAVERFDRALELNPELEDARINRNIAIARAKLVEKKGGDMGQQEIGADEIVFDKNKKSGGQDTETEGSQPLSDSEMQALWLRRVQTKPADFLKAKFAYQLSAGEQEGGGE